MPAIILPDGFSFVAASLASTILLNTWQGMKVGQARKAAAVKYPQLYAEKAEAESDPLKMKFNCTQRAHQNTLESMPALIIGTVVTGLKYPQIAAGLCGTFVVGKVLYTIGYASGDPKKRNSSGGFLGSIATLGLILSSTYTAYQLVASEL